MTKSRGIRPPSKPWTDSDDQVMRALYPDMLSRDVATQLGRTEKAVYSRAKKLGLCKSQAFLCGPMARLLDGHRDNGRRFLPGNKPWCSGKKGVAGVQDGCRATQFRKGALVGRNAARFIPIGGHRINAEGYLDRKVRNDGPPQDRFERVHRLVWIEANGPIPENHVVVFRAGMKTTVLEQITPDRLECITRAELVYRNRLPPELMELHQLRGQITRAINQRTKGQEA